MMSSTKLVLNNKESSSDSDASNSDNLTVASTNLNNPTDSEKGPNHQELNPSREPHVDHSGGNSVEHHVAQLSTQPQPKKAKNSAMTSMTPDQFRHAFDPFMIKQRSQDAAIKLTQTTLSEIICQMKNLNETVQSALNKQPQPSLANNSIPQVTIEPFRSELTNQSSILASNTVRKSRSITNSDIIDNYKGSTPTIGDQHRRMTKNVSEVYQSSLQKYPDYTSLKFYYQKAWYTFNIPSCVSLLPKTRITIQDNLTNIMFNILAGKKSQDINPIFHNKIHHIYAKDTNAHLKSCEETLKKLFNDIITNQWTENSKAQFLNINIVIQCIEQAYKYGFDHPLFAPKILLQCISTNDKTKELWNRCKHRYIENSITNELKDLHIIDMYQETVENNISSRSIQPLLKELKTCIQKQDKAVIYAERKMAIFKKLLQLHNHSQIGETDDNNSIASTLLDALRIIKIGANRSFSHFIDQDKVEERNLPWNFDVFNPSNTLDAYMDKLHESIIALAKQTDKFVCLMNATQSTNHHGKANSRAASNGNSKGKAKFRIFTDNQGNCSNSKCKDFPAHKPGGIPGCTYTCKLKQKGIKCSTPNDADKVCHAFSKKCTKCHREHWKSKSKEGKNSTQDSTNLSAIHNHTTGRNSNLGTPDVEACLVNFINPETGATVQLTLAFDSGSTTSLVIKPEYFKSLQSMAKRCASKDLQRANGTKTFDSFLVHYTDSDNAIHKVQIFVGDVPTVAQGVIPSSLFKNFGVNIISTHNHNNHIKLTKIQSSNNNNNLAAMVQNNQLDEITNEIRALIKDNIVSSATIENLTDSFIPDTDLEHNHDADQLFQRLLILFKAKDTQRTKSRILKKFLDRILRYETLDTMTPKQSKFHQKVKNLLQQHSNILIKKGDPIKRNLFKDIATHQT